MALVRLNQNLRLERCPFCNVDRPNLDMIWQTKPVNSENLYQGLWRFYKCGRCGGIVTAWADQEDHYTKGIIPSPQMVSQSIPERANSYLSQAIQSLHAPAGAIMLAASSIDSMLKDKGYSKGNLYPRIDKAAQEHLITESMAIWAHRVRLDSNSQRHADENFGMPTVEDAQKAVDLAQAFGQFLFVLPAMVEKGLEDTSSAIRKTE